MPQQAHSNAITHVCVPQRTRRCEESDHHREGSRIITTSHYHSRIGVEVPPYELTTSWTRDLRRFDNVITALWVLYQVRVRRALAGIPPAVADLHCCGSAATARWMLHQVHV